MPGAALRQVKGMIGDRSICAPRPRTQGGMGGGGHMMRSPQGGLSARKDGRKVVMCPRWGSDPITGHPGGVGCDTACAEHTGLA